MTESCVVCGTNVQTLADVPLCSSECKRYYAQQAVNQMSDTDAHCPTCGKGDFDSVQSVLSHHNQKSDTIHDFRLVRTETCEACETAFEPKNYNQPNRFCSRACFESAMRLLFKRRTP